MAADCDPNHKISWTLAAWIEHSMALNVEKDRVQAERDRVYMTRFASIEVAVQTALAAQEKSVNAAFAASEKAGEKLDDAQTTYNATHNDLAHKMETQQERMITRVEVLDKFETVNKEIRDLRESRSEGAGKTQGVGAAWGVMIAVVSLVLGAIGAFIAVYAGK